MELTVAAARAARETVHRHLPPTPMWRYPVLDAAVGATVYVKHENVQPTGAFKVRGGLTLLESLPAAERAKGLVSYSTGNHAQSLAYACARHGVPCTVVMPSGASPTKAAAVRGWGAEVVLTGSDLEAAQRYAEQHAADIGARLVSPGDTPELLAGLGTLYLEILEAQPDLDAIVVPVGSGTGAAAAATIAAGLAPNCRVYGVQSDSSPAGHDSWRAGEPVSRPNRTRAEGLATGRGFVLTQELLRAHLADFLLVTDDQIDAARRLLAQAAHTLAEGAGAAALAAVEVHPAHFTGKRIAIVCTGGNASAHELATLG